VCSPWQDHAEQLPRPGHRVTCAGILLVCLVFAIGLVVVLVSCVVAQVVGGILVAITIIRAGLGVKAEVRPEHQPMAGDRLGEGVRDLGVDPQVMLPVQDVAEHRRDDGVPGRTVAVQHAGDGSADLGPLRGWDRGQAIREHPVHHWQGQERPGGLQQFQPAVPAADLLADSAACTPAPGAHVRAPSGTHSATANGNTSSRTPA